MGPSGQILVNTVTIYPAVRSQDGEGAPQFTYPAASLSDEPCSVQAHEVMEVTDEQGRVTQEREYTIMFGASTSVGPRDKVIYVDWSGVTHTLFAYLERDEAGRGMAYTVRAIERV